MKKNLFLTSMFVIVGTNMAFAADDYVTSQSMCTVDVLNTYGGENGETAQLEADWELLSIACPAGQYLSKTTGECETCLENNFCLGGTFDVEMANTGLTQCSTLANGEYAYSFTGASANAGCYRNCATADVPHSTGVKGQYYYDDTNKCSATGCAVGWKMKTRFSTFESRRASAVSSSPNRYNYYGFDGSLGEQGYGYGYNDNPIQYSNNNYPNPGYYGISSTYMWAVEFKDLVMVRGIASCNSTSGSNNNYAYDNDSSNWSRSSDTFSKGGSGNACWCQVNGYRNNSSETYQTVASNWVFVNNSNCGQTCAEFCAQYFVTNAYFYDALTTVLPDNKKVTLNYCDAHKIFLDWYNDTVANSGTKITVQEEAQQCLYDSTITVPDQAHTPNKTGYTFGGWKLRTNN